jgi:hypothetical protein
MRQTLFSRAATGQRLRTEVLALTVMLCLVVLGSVTARAQSSAGLTGTVLDASGAVIPNAQVTITNEQTGAVQKTVSSSAGTFAVSGLTPDKYTVTVQAPSFRTEVENNVNIDVSVTAVLTITLSTGEASQTVEVTANAISLNTTSPQLGTTLEPAVVAALPVEVSGRGRQIDSLQFTAPGTTGSTFSHRISGGVDFQEEILYNGIPVVQPETEGYTTNFNPPFEMVQEFRVQQTTFSSQFGLGQGALTYQMATGTNRYHGDLFEINRNSYFDSVGFFNGPNFNPANTTDVPPTDRENNYGFTVDGPLSIPHLYNAKNKTFFHYSQEWFKEVVENTNPGTVPTTKEAGGDFSDYVDSNGNLIPIFVPQGVSCDGLTPGQQFPGNVIPTSCFSKNSAALLQYLPAPNLPGHTSNRSFAPYPNDEIQHVWGFTIDQKLTQMQSLHYSEWRNTYSNVGFDQAPIVTPPNPLNSLKRTPYVGTGFLLNYSNMLTPHLVMTAGADWIGELNNQFNVTTGYNSSVIQNSVVPPEIAFSGTYAPTQWGTDGAWVQSINRKLGLSAVNNWLWTKGRHTFNIGGEARRAYQDDNEDQTAGGQFTFSSHETSTQANGGANFGTDGSPFASFLLGIPDEANRSNSQELRLRNFDISPYIEDDIKLTPKLTVNLGIRWDIMVPFTENKNLVVFFNPNIPNPGADNLPGAATQLGSGAGKAGYDRASTHFTHLGPRFGLSYELNPKTVIQGGFALAFLNGGAYEYGTHKVAVSYGNLLVGSYSLNSTGGLNSSYGSWDNNPMPDPAPTPFSPTLGLGTQIFDFSQSDGYAPYTEQWNLNVQRELPWNTFLTVAWVGNRAIHLDAQLNPVSQLPPGDLALGGALSDVFAPGQQTLDGVTVPYANFVSNFGGSATVRQALQPYPQYGNVYNLFDHGGTSYYESLQVTAEKRLSNGLSFLAGYTLSRLMDNTSSGFSTFTATAVNKFNQKAEYTVSTSDEPQTLKVSGTYELPIGPGKKFFNNKKVTGQVLGGWQVSWITDYEAGTAFGVSENSYLGLGNSFESGNNRPNIVAGQNFNTSYQAQHDYLSGKTAVQPRTFNTGAFSDSGQYVLGNAVRDYGGLRNPAFYNEDANIRKRFFLWEHVQAVLQFDYFNLFNRTQLQGPDTNFNDSTFGQITNNSAQTNGTTYGNREGQIQARIEF